VSNILRAISVCVTNMFLVIAVSSTKSNLLEMQGRQFK
jgi:hypothetical protein